MVVEDRIGRAIEVRDQNIDAQEVIWRVRENIRKRGANLLKFDPVADDFLGWAESAEPYLLYRDAVTRAEQLVDKIVVSDQLRPSRTTVDRLLTYVRRPLHQLVQFYVGLMVERQRVFNLHVVQALKAVAPQIEEGIPRWAEAERLGNELRALEDRVARVEGIFSTLAEGRDGLVSGPGSEETGAERAGPAVARFGNGEDAQRGEV